MAEYLILIYGEEAALDNPEPGAFDQMMKGHQVFGERNAASLRGGTRCSPRPRPPRCGRAPRVSSS